MTDHTINGEFTRLEINQPDMFRGNDRINPGQAIVDMLQRAQRDRYNPIAEAHREAVQQLAKLYVPQLPVTSSPDHFLAVADFVVRWAQIGDRMMKVIGEEVESNAVERVDLSMFTDRFFMALDGDTTFELEKCAEAAQAQIDEACGVDGDDGDYAWDQRA